MKSYGRKGGVLSVIGLDGGTADKVIKSGAGRRVLFMGTPDFAVPSLEALVGAGYGVVAAVTQPDRPKGRGGRLSEPAVKVSAERLGIPVMQPESVRGAGFLNEVASLAPDVAVTAAYGKMLPQSFLSMPAYGTVNVHASLLPAYRGAAPIQRAIMAGESVTGVTTMLTEIGMDTGDVLMRAECPIGFGDDCRTLSKRLSGLGADLLLTTLDGIFDGTLRGERQDSGAATYAPMLTKADGAIDWDRPAKEIADKVRALCEWPVAYAELDGLRHRILAAAVGGVAGQACNGGGSGPGAGSDACGTVTEVGEVFIRVRCGVGHIEILRIQPDGGKAMEAAEFVRGRPGLLGRRFT
ncbi:MAG: methionyl-tRNA formyltransferase [Oscillospiraceae bacterium]|nr:methionyl-tRNA formyltransferase [Oscillospiraceae bacterium]